jgi:hypothetical protein
VSDIKKLAILDLHKIAPKKTEHDGRFWGFFDSQESAAILEAYDSGELRVVARDFASSIDRVKDQIFELERARQRDGAKHHEPVRQY